MINPEAHKRIKELAEEYEMRWGKEVELRELPPSLSQEKLLSVLERTVNTGESILVGYSKLYLSI